MKALAADSIGALGALRVAEVATPTPGPGEVRVVVHAAAVNPADHKVLEGEFAGRFLHARPRPLIPGYDLAGVVDAIGPGVTGVLVGDRVFGFQQYQRSTRHGSFAEQTVVGADAIATLPDAVDFATAAAAATPSLTALQALRDVGGLEAGQRVLVIGAAGGVGSLAVAIAKRLGAHVTAVCSASTAAMVRELGADEVLDRGAGDPYGQGGPYDVIFDTPGLVSYGEVVRVLAKDGAYVTTLPSPGFALAKLRTLVGGRRAGFVVVQSRRADLEQLAGWLAAGLPVAIERRFAVRDGAAAIAALKAGGRKGRLVIDVAGGW